MRVLAAYRWLLTERAGAFLAGLVLVLGFLAVQAQNFRLDASADSLLLEDDPDLQLLRQVAARYESRELLIVTFTPERDLFDPATIQELDTLSQRLGQVEGIESVMSLVDVPLIKSSDVPLLDQLSDVQTLTSESIDRRRAREELTTSPVFKNLIISPNGQTTAIALSLAADPEATKLLRTRNELLVKRRTSGLDPSEAERLEQVRTAYEEARADLSEQRHQTIAAVRSVIADYDGQAEIHLGGVPMIADDMITFVRNDLIVFGTGVFIFVIGVLWLIFRRLRWVVIPILSCAYASIAMCGILGWVGWDVTVISSNFLALMLIITISMNIHLVVRYLQLFRDNPERPQSELVWNTLAKMGWPCLYTALTTIIGFASLVMSDIKPVQDFGLMMSAGLAVSFLTSFSLLPAILLVIGRPAREDSVHEGGRAIVSGLARFTEQRGPAILATAACLFVISAVGISRLQVENSFIDYFREDTEIYQGMKLIDQRLGGTTPLEVILHMSPEEPPAVGLGTDAPTAAEEDADDEFDDDFLDDYDVAGGPEYWFTPWKIERIKRVHDYLDSLDHVGKVLSLASLIRVAEDINEGEPLDSLELGVLYNKLPEDIRAEIVDPYFDHEADEARLVLRILDSNPGLRRAELLETIRTGLRDELDLEANEVTVTGTMVLYNNMLQSLYRSQISSLGAVMVGIGIMFLFLFRSLPLAVMGILPNVLAAAVVLGIMGLAGIPLDVMTITISAISIGIAVDNAIHYIYRFREEYARTGDYSKTLRICHESIGRAVLYTSATIIFGFSILALSNFLPTIYFGMLTGLAMLVALLGALTLLPRLILYWRPFQTYATTPSPSPVAHPASRERAQVSQRG